MSRGYLDNNHQRYFQEPKQKSPYAGRRPAVPTAKPARFPILGKNV